MTSTYAARNLIKLFELIEKNRSLLTFSDTTKIRLSPELLRVLLKKDSDGYYPENDSDAYVTTWTTSPEACLQWLAFEAITTEKKDDTGTVVTSYYFRLTDGTDEFYWTGAAWTVSTTLWNTEQEINEGLSSWSGNTIGVIVNPRTSDKTITPEVLELRFAYSGRIDFLKDLITSFTEELKENFVAWRQHVLEVTADSDTFNLSTEYPPELDLSIVSILAVYDHDVDPNHNNNLFSSWADPVLTLTSVVSTGHVLWIDLEYSPQVAFATDVDYLETSKVPAIWIEDASVKTVRGKYRNHVLRRDTNEAYQWKNTRVGDVLIYMAIETSDPSDHLRVTGQAEQFFATLNQIRSLALDERFDVVIDESYGGRSGPDNKGRLSSRYRVTVKNAMIEGAAEQTHGVKTFNLDLQKEA